MDAEKLALFERCYRNWNGTSVMEGAFKELLAEVANLRAKVKRSCDHMGRTHSADGWHCPYCDMRGPANSHPAQ